MFDRVPGLDTCFYFSTISAAVLVLLFFGTFLARRDRVKMQFFLSELLISVLSIGLCTTLILFVLEHFVKWAERIGISKEQLAFMPLTPLHAFGSALLWFAVGFFWTLAYQHKLFRHNKHAFHFAVISCFAGNAVWLLAMAANLMYE
jgi:hypothetical protein